LAEAFHLAYAADFVVEVDLLDATERSAEELAATAAVDPRLLEGLLDLLACRTDLVARGPRGFKKGPGLGVAAEAILHQYLGAYGSNAASLAGILACPGSGRGVTDRNRHAVAFARVPGPGAALLPDLLTKLELGRVLDLGCGTGELLTCVACGDHRFRGWGVDSNPAMISLAEERLRASPAADGQVRFFVGDVGDLASTVPGDVLAQVATVVAASLLNEFFDPDTATAVRWLRSVSRVLPGRVLVVADYYGALGHVVDPPPRRAIHDWIQLISSQGVPPPDLHGWEAVYVAADCALLHAVEDTDAGVFIHFVRLAGSKTSAGMTDEFGSEVR
jgi:SAM-dependent methyltransferase